MVAFNPRGGWSRDATEDVAQELEQMVAEGHEVTESVREFIERFTGRPISVQLLLPCEGVLNSPPSSYLPPPSPSGCLMACRIQSPAHPAIIELA